MSPSSSFRCRACSSGSSRLNGPIRSGRSGSRSGTTRTPSRRRASPSARWRRYARHVSSSTWRSLENSSSGSVTSRHYGLPSGATCAPRKRPLTPPEERSRLSTTRPDGRTRPLYLPYCLGAHRTQRAERADRLQASSFRTHQGQGSLASTQRRLSRCPPPREWNGLRAVGSVRLITRRAA